MKWWNAPEYDKPLLMNYGLPGYVETAVPDPDWKPEIDPETRKWKRRAKLRIFQHPCMPR